MSAVYGEVRERLRRFASFERTGDAAHLSPPASTERLLGDLGRPDRRYAIVHVAGTLGKGLTASMIAAMLAEGGLRTGLYTSPAVLGVRDGIRIDGDPIAEDAFARSAAAVLAVAESYGDRVPLSAFDLTTATALLAFAELGVAWAVVEAGLGGRDDATNVTAKALAVLTAIDHDHAAVLGPTLEEIAEHKLGILRPGVPAVVAEQEPAAGEILRRRLAGVEDVAWSEGLRVGTTADGGLEVVWPDGETVRARPRPWWPATVCVPCLKTALTARERLAAGAVRRDAWTQAALAVALPGRLEYREELVWQGTACGPVVLDGCHSPAAVRACAAQVRAWGVEGYTLVLGLARDKLTEPLGPALAALCRRARRVVLAPFDSPRSSPPSVASYLLESDPGLAPEVARTLDEALTRATASAGRPLVVAGSLYLIRDVLSRLRDPSESSRAQS